MITQVFIFGSSSAYGVGGSNGGWGDLVKQHLHAKMYGNGGIGETYEVYNFGKSGAKIEFVKDTFQQQLKDYGRGHRTIVLLAVGGNNTKAEGEPTNFASTPESYITEMRELLTMLQQHCDGVVMVGSNWPVDESKTNPKTNPLTGDRSYFTNARRHMFNTVLKQLCTEINVELVELDVDKHAWLESYQYKDGLHPNQAGHQLIFESIKPRLDKLIEVTT